jgi:AraC-like DNA-binding protein
LDALTALANGLNLRAKLAYAGGVCGHWWMDHNSDHSVWFHLVSKGRAWVHASVDGSPLELDEGDLAVFLPHASQHYLSYSPSDLPGNSDDTLLTDVDNGDTALICGEIELGVPPSPLWRSLPAEIIIRKGEADNALAKLIEVVMAETAEPRFGSTSIIERLCDSFFILVIRKCIECGAVRGGVFAAMQDRRLARILESIHQQPWQRWTIAELCSLAGLSKTVLADRFAATIGMSPIEYLTNWRMQIAARWLTQSAMSIEQLAERCGYESASAFNKAFKRSYGISPGAYRQGNIRASQRGER